MRRIMFLVFVLMVSISMMAELVPMLLKVREIEEKYHYDQKPPLEILSNGDTIFYMHYIELNSYKYTSKRERNADVAIKYSVKDYGCYEVVCYFITLEEIKALGYLPRRIMKYGMFTNFAKKVAFPYYYDFIWQGDGDKTLPNGKYYSQHEPSPYVPIWTDEEPYQILEFDSIKNQIRTSHERDYSVMVEAKEIVSTGPRGKQFGHGVTGGWNLDCKATWNSIYKLTFTDPYFKGVYTHSQPQMSYSIGESHWIGVKNDDARIRAEFKNNGADVAAAKRDLYESVLMSCEDKSLINSRFTHPFSVRRYYNFIIVRRTDYGNVWDYDRYSSYQCLDRTLPSSGYSQAVENVENKYDYVDLGLPSGTLWATCNYGGVAPFSKSVKTDLCSSEILKTLPKIEVGKYDVYEDYASAVFRTMVDKYKSIPAKYDIAANAMGGRWRRPADEQWLELMNSCEVVEEEMDSVWGSRFIGPNGKSIFLPWGDYWAGGLQHDAIINTQKYTRLRDNDGSRCCTLYLRAVINVNLSAAEKMARMVSVANYKELLKQKQELNSRQKELITQSVDVPLLSDYFRKYYEEVSRTITEETGLQKIYTIMAAQDSFLVALNEYRLTAQLHQKVLDTTAPIADLKKSYETYYQSADMAWEVGKDISMYALVRSKMTDCLAFAQTMTEVLTNDDIIQSSFSEYKSFLNIYCAFFSTYDKSWTETTDLEKLKQLQDVQKVYLDNATRIDLKKMNKKLKKDKDHSIENAIILLNQPN